MIASETPQRLEQGRRNTFITGLSKLRIKLDNSTSANM